MNVLTLHSYRRCPFAIRVRMVLEEKGIPYRIVEEDLSNFSTELLALHPEGRVPLLIHHLPGKDLAIYQSTIITEYLEEVFPEHALMPQAPSARAELRLWTYWCDTIFKPDLDAFKYEFKKLPPPEADMLLSRLHEHFAHWETALRSHRFLLGDEMTLADIHLFPFARQFVAIKQPVFAGIDKYTRLAEWLTEMVARPAFSRVMETKHL